MGSPLEKTMDLVKSCLEPIGAETIFFCEPTIELLRFLYSKDITVHPELLSKGPSTFIPGGAYISATAASNWDITTFLNIVFGYALDPNLIDRPDIKNALSTIDCKDAIVQNILIELGSTIPTSIVDIKNAALVIAFVNMLHRVDSWTIRIPDILVDELVFDIPVKDLILAHVVRPAKRTQYTIERIRLALQNQQSQIRFVSLLNEHIDVPITSKELLDYRVVSVDFVAATEDKNTEEKEPDISFTFSTPDLTAKNSFCSFSSDTVLFLEDKFYDKSYYYMAKLLGSLRLGYRSRDPYTTIAAKNKKFTILEWIAEIATKCYFQALKDHTFYTSVHNTAEKYNIVSNSTEWMLNDTDSPAYKGTIAGFSMTHAYVHGSIMSPYSEHVKHMSTYVTDMLIHKGLKQRLSIGEQNKEPAELGVSRIFGIVEDLICAMTFLLKHFKQLPDTEFIGIVERMNSYITSREQAEKNVLLAPRLKLDPTDYMLHNDSRILVHLLNHYYPQAVSGDIYNAANNKVYTCIGKQILFTSNI